jgi:hypothetical protein
MDLLRIVSPPGAERSPRWVKLTLTEIEELSWYFDGRAQQTR